MHKQIEFFLQAKKKDRRAEKTIKTYNTALRQFDEHLQSRYKEKHIGIEDITSSDDLETFLSKIKDNKTYQIYRQILSSFSSFWKDQKLISKNLVESIPIRRPKKPYPKLITVEDYKKLLNACEKSKDPLRNKLLISLAFNLRAIYEELKQLKKKHVTLDYIKGIDVIEIIKWRKKNRI